MCHVMPAKLVQATCVLHLLWRTKVKLAIVFTDFLLVQAYIPLLTLTFTLSFCHSSLFLRSLLLTRFGDTQRAEIVFPQNNQKDYIFFYLFFIYIFFTKTN